MSEFYWIWVRDIAYGSTKKKIQKGDLQLKEGGGASFRFKVYKAFGVRSIFRGVSGSPHVSPISSAKAI